MKIISLYSLKIIVVAIIALFYLLFSMMIFRGMDDLSIIAVIRHSVLVSGFVPTLCWSAFFILSRLGY